MKKIIYLLMIIGFVTSCDDTESPVFQGNDELIYFEKTSRNLDVVIDSTGTVEVPVAITELQENDVNVGIELVVEDDATTADSENYSFDDTAVIPAGEYSGSFTVDGVDQSVEVDPKVITFKISDAEGLLFEKHTAEVTIKQVCPLKEDNLFVGEYLLEQVSPATLGDGPAFETQVVTLFNNDDDEDKEVVNTTKRAFEAVYLPGAGVGQPPMTVGFDLICNNVVINEPQTDNDEILVNETFVTCDTETAGITLGPGDSTGNYDEFDDSSFTLIIADFFDGGGCGISTTETEFLLTKQ